MHYLMHYLMRIYFACLIVGVVAEHYPREPQPLVRIQAVFNVLTYGAIPNDGLSDSTAFRATFAAACAAPGRDSVYAPTGTWDFQKDEAYAAVYVEGCLGGIDFFGDGIGLTIFKAFPGSHSAGGDYLLFLIQNSDDWDVSDFTCDGNRSNITDADEQTHCFVIYNCEDFEMHDAVLSHQWGDGVKLIGDPSTNRRITLRDLVMDDNGRSGIAIHAAADVLIERFTASNINQSCLDTEPGGGIGIEGLILRDATCTRPSSWVYTESISISGGTGGACSPDPFNALHCATKDVLLQNVVVYGCIGGVQGYNIEFDNVRVACPNGGAAASFGRNYQVVTIARSAFGASGDGAALSFSADTATDNITITDTRLTVQHGTAIVIDGGAGVISATGIRVLAQAPFAQGIGWLSNTLADTPDMTGLVFGGSIIGLRIGVNILRRGQFAAVVTDMTVSGTITARAGSDTYGILCANGAPLVLNNTASITATNPTDGCP